MPIDDLSEKFVWVDEEDNKLGYVSREKAHSDKSYIHRAVSIIVTNVDEKVLFQKRSSSKDLYPGHWGVGCAGHVGASESYQESAEREMREELNLDSKPEVLKKIFIETGDESEIVQVYITKSNDLPIEYDKDEIEEVRWVDANKIRPFIANHRVTPIDYKVLRLLEYI